MTARGNLEQSLADTLHHISELAQVLQNLTKRTERLEALGLIGRLVDVAISTENAMEFIEHGGSEP